VAGHLTGPSPPHGPEWPGYVAQVEAGIPSCFRTRDSLLAELVDGLTDATEHYVALGLTRAEAERRAIGDSGPAPVVAHAITEHLGTRYAGRAAAALLLTGPMVGMLWLATLTPGQTPDHLMAKYPLLIPVLICAVASAALTLVVIRAPIPRPWIDPRDLLVIACIAAAASDAVILTSAGVQITHEPGGTPWFIAILAATASVTRLTLTPRAARRALQTRA
jgi:hypothetical protein